ncbi:Putative AC transposase [Linum perenne]
MLMAPRAEDEIPGEWRSLWGLNIPAKVKNLLWRLAKGVVPHRVRLCSCGIDVPNLCGVCSEMNLRVWRGEACIARLIVAAADEGLHEWEQLHAPPALVRTPRDPSFPSWHHPPTGQLKCNTNVALFETEHCTGMGMLFRDDHDQVIPLTRYGPGLPSPREGEALALLTAMRWQPDSEKWNDVLGETLSFTLSITTFHIVVSASMLCSFITRLRSIYTNNPATFPDLRHCIPTHSSPTLSLFISTIVVSTLDCRVGTPVAILNSSLLHDSHLQSPADWKNPSKVSQWKVILIKEVEVVVCGVVLRKGNEFVEGESFIEMMKEAYPLFNMPCRKSIRANCLKLFVNGKEELQSFFKNKCDGRISITIDCWTSVQNFNYICIIAHFVGVDWKLYKKIINSRRICSHKGVDTADAIATCLQEWNLTNICFIREYI